MRPDMKKVLTERPRSGSWQGQRRVRAPSVRLWDGEDGYEDAEHPGRPRRTRHFDDLLGPLRKWLRRQVGRPWNTVWSEICATVDAHSVSGQHLREHVRWEVATAVRMNPRGQAWHQGGASWQQGRVDGLYVHPRHGLLCWQEPDRSRWKRPPEVEDPRLVPLGEGRFHQQIAGLWFEVHTQDPGRSQLNPTVPRLRWRGRELQIVGKRQLSGAELRAAGRVNGEEAQVTVARPAGQMRALSKYR